MWPHLETKTGRCFSPILSDRLFRGINHVLKCGIYLTFTVAIVTKMTTQIGLK